MAYEPAIERALEIASESSYDGADLLLVTDELCRLGDSGDSSARRNVAGCACTRS